MIAPQNPQTQPTTEDQYRQILKHIYEDNLGGYLSPLSGQFMGVSGVFRKIEKLLQQKKKDPSTLLPVTTNYVRHISQIVASAVIGTGISWQSEDKTDTEQEKAGFTAKNFKKWYKAEAIDQKLFQALSLALASGKSGLRVGWNYGTITFTPFCGENLQERSQNVAEIREIIDYTNKNGETEERMYNIQYERQNGRWFVRHSLHKITKTGECNEKTDKKAMKELFGESGLDENGYEPKTYAEKPYIMLKSMTEAADGQPTGMCRYVLDKIQVLWFYDTLKTLDHQAHFLSKVAVPRAYLQIHPETGELVDLSSLSYVPIEDDAPIPQYVQKQLKEPHEAMTEHRRQLLCDVAFGVQIPADLLIKDASTANQKVEAIKINKQPYARLISVYQNQLGCVFGQIMKLWHGEQGKEAPQVTLEWQGVFDVE